MPITLDDVTFETFEPLTGTTFQVTTPDGQTFELKLTQVLKMMEGVKSKKLKRQPFSLYFQGADTFLLPQHVYAFTSAELGDTLNIFLVPLGHDDGAYQYEAVFT